VACAFAAEVQVKPAGTDRGGAAGERPPNIIVIMVDDMSVGGLSCYENKFFKTPEIKRWRRGFRP